MRQSVQRVLRGAILALTVAAGMGAGSVSAAPHDLRSAVLTKGDVPAGFGQPIIKVYQSFPGTMAIHIGSVHQTCPLPSYYRNLAWQEGVYEVIPLSTRQSLAYDITLCSSRFGTAQKAHVAYVADLRVVQALLRTATARKMHTVFMQIPRVGDEAVAWKAPTKAGTCYWMRFRRHAVEAQLYGPCGLTSTASLLRWARTVSSRIP